MVRRERASAMPAEARRAAIVAAAIPVLVERGAHVTTKELAEAAGVAEGTLFRVFADKDELLDAALDSALDTTSFEAELAGIDPGAGLESALVSAISIVQRRVVDVWSVVSALDPSRQRRSARPPADSPGLIAIFEAAPGRLRVDPAVAARLVRALTLSLTHPMLAGEPTDPAEIADLVLHGITGGDRS